MSLRRSKSSISQKETTDVKSMLKSLHKILQKVEDERSTSETTLASISRTHQKIMLEKKISSYYRKKLETSYAQALKESEAEVNVLRECLEKISEIKHFQNELMSDRPKNMRRGVLMHKLQQHANSLPLWISKPGERLPHLCGAIPADTHYIAKAGDKVAARAKGGDGEENWILAEVHSFNGNTTRYEVDDIDAEEGKERYTLSRRKVVPLPIWKANPETDSEALFPKDTLVLALYPQTTCFYPALVHKPPSDPSEDYSVLFEDATYEGGYSPPLCVAQKYVIHCKEDRKK